MYLDQKGQQLIILHDEPMDVCYIILWAFLKYFKILKLKQYIFWI